jgi:hypothetical protein
MQKLPASTGWLWVKEGFELFRKQPADISTLFIAYMFLMIVVGILPLIGQLLPLILVPVFSMAFMEACRMISEGKRVYPNLLLIGFRSPHLKSLLLLGLLYVTAAMGVVAASSLIDGGLFWRAMSGQEMLDAVKVEGSNLLGAMLFSAVLYIPAAMAFWYAAPLVFWQNMPVAKALFYSFFAVYRNGRAFIVYALAWLAIGVLLPSIVSLIAGAILNRALATMFVLLPLSLVLTVVMYCSFYPAYIHAFGKPDSKSPLQDQAYPEAP